MIGVKTPWLRRALTVRIATVKAQPKINRLKLSWFKTVVMVATTSMLVHWGQAAPAPQTMKNLNTAYQGEANATETYLAYARRAEVDGFASVAKLFRAASASEGVHRYNHRQAMVDLGGTPQKIDRKHAVVAATRDNLKESVADETEESAVMYPGFLLKAEENTAVPAERSFRFAMNTEKAHARLFQRALQKLESRPANDYFVCSVCGMTLDRSPGKKCELCGKPSSSYHEIE